MERIKKLVKSERGIVLVITLLILTLLIGAGTGAIVSTQMDLKTSGNLKTGTQAFYNALAGLNHARQELADSTGVYYFETVSVSTSFTEAFGNGNYTVELTPSGSPKIIGIKSEGTAPNNARRVVQARVHQTSDPPEQALTSNGNLVIGGNIKLMGTCGGVHSNDDLTIQNSAAEKTDGFTASGTMSVSGTPCIGSDTCDDPSPDPAFVLDTNVERDDYETAHDNQREIPIPTINSADFAPRVAALGAAGNGYILGRDGKVYTGGTCDTTDSTGTTIGLCTSGTEVSGGLSGWTWNSGQGKWRCCSGGGSPQNGVFYAETSVAITGSPGSVASPWEATIIARDSIDWGGSPSVRPYPTADPQLQDILIVTGNDLKIGGNLGLSGQGGAVLVHQQIGFSGTVTIYGYVFAGNGTPTWSGDPFSSNTSGTNLVDSQSVSGNPTIIYDCGGIPCNNPACGIPKVEMVAGSWREGE